MQQKSKSFFIFSALILLFILLIENVNQRFWLSDFKVYYLAAEAFLSHQPVYGQVFGESTGFYKYSPILLYLFAPATALSFFAASVIHYLLTCLGLWGGLTLALRLISEQSGWKIQKPSLILSFTFIAVLNHFFRELHLGNVNVILVALLLSGFYLYRRQHLAPAALILVICLLFKPYFVILLIPFILKRQWRLFIYGFGWLMVLLGLFFVVRGPAEAMELHKAWFESMMEHSNMLQSWNTVPFLVSLIIGHPLPAVLISGITLLTLFTAWSYISKKKSGDFAEFVLFISFLAVLPSLLITDTEHFLFSYPLIVFLIFYSLKASKNFRLILIFILLMYGANSPEIFGSTLSDHLEHHGMLGLANILILTMSLWVMNQMQEKEGEMYE